jgi:hypothetical protein
MKKNKVDSSDDEWVEAPSPEVIEPAIKRDDWMGGSFESIGKERKRRDPDKLQDHELTPKELADRQKKAARIDRELNPDFKTGVQTDNVSTIRKYEFGDKGSSWRMMKLKRVFEMAERDSLPLEQVALERYGSLEELEEAMAERDFLDGKRHKKTSGSVKKYSKYMDPRASSSDQQKVSQTSSVPLAIASQNLVKQDNTAMSTDQLNKLYSKLLKAQMMGLPEADELQRQYELEKEKSENNSKVYCVIQL